MFVIYCLYATATGNIIFGSSHLHRTAIRQCTRHLHQTFPKRAVTYNHCTVIILQCTRQDFRSGSSTAIYQYSNRNIRIQWFAQGLIRITCLFYLTFRCYNRLTTGQKVVGYLYSLFQQPTAIVAQINYQWSDTLLLQIKKSLLKLFRRISWESTQVDVTDIVIQLTIIRNKRQLDVFTDNCKIQWLCLTGTLNLQLETCPYLSTKYFTHIRISGQIFSIYFKQDITCFQSHFGSRHIFVRLHNYCTLQFRLISDDGTYTSIRSLKHLFQLTPILFRIKFRIRVQRIQHRIDTLSYCLIRVQCIYIEHIQFLHDGIEYIQVLCNLETAAITTLETKKDNYTYY